MDGGTSNGRFQPLAELAAVAVIYFATAKGSLAFASINPSATPVWPPTGLALGLTILLGNRVLPAIFLGALAANLATTGGLGTSLAIAAGNTAEAFGGAFLIVRWANGVDAFQTPVGIGKIAASIAASTTVSATTGTIALVLTGAAAMTAAAVIWMTWWLGDMAGAAMVAPVVVLWARDRRPASVLGASETAALFALTIVAGALALGPFVPIGPGRNGLAFLVIVPLMWAALRGSPRNTATVALILSVFAVWGVAAGDGPFLEPSLNASFLLVVSFIVSVTLPSLALATAVASRDRAIAEQDLAVRAGEIGIWDWNLLTNEIVYSEQAKSIFGFPAGRPVTFEQVRDATHPEDLPNTSAMGRRARDPTLRETTPYEYRIVRPDGAERWVLANGRAIFEGDRAVRYLGTIRDITDRKLLTKDLEETYAKLGLAMSAGRLAVWEFRAADRTLVGSPELNVLLGFPRDQILTTDEYRSRCAPGEYDRIRRLALAAIRDRETFMEAEVQLVFPGDRPLWLLLRAEFLPIPGSAMPNCIGVVVDITAKKELEGHLMLLMAELNHRVKNALAVVQSISAQTYRTSLDPRDAHVRFEERLRALARAHDVLTSRDWRDADLGELVTATVTPHSGRAEDRLHTSGPAVVLTPQSALALSMVFHELATNALKYGALSGEDGRVELTWDVGTHSDRRLLLKWQERGGPLVTPPQHEGFGLRMILRSLEGIGGEAKIDFEPSGFACVLRLDLDQKTGSTLG